MLSFEVLPWEGKTLYLVDYVDLHHKKHPVDLSDLAVVTRALTSIPLGQRKIFGDLKEAKDFMDTYLEHFALFLAKKGPPEGGWIWTAPTLRKPTYCPRCGAGSSSIGQLDSLDSLGDMDYERQGGRWYCIICGWQEELERKQE